MDHIVCIIGIIHQMPQISAILYEICLMNQRQLFLNHVGQTSDAPLALEIVRAQGCTMWDVHGKAYIDLIAGISVCNVGHCHPEVVQAVQQQAATYMHIMVYGELVESPQVQYAKKLTDHLPSNLNAVFYTASGSEATEGAMKLAKRYTRSYTDCVFQKLLPRQHAGCIEYNGQRILEAGFPAAFARYCATEL